jgi:tetratricopeptide (TPR) repeat protein
MRTRAFALLVMFVARGIPASFAQNPGLPDLPQINAAELPPETQKQVQDAYTAAHGHPDNAAAVGELGMLLDLYNRPEAAILCYQRAHGLAPRSFKWLYYWGILLIRQRRKHDAVPVLTSALQLQPDYLPAKLKLAEALVDSGRNEEAGTIYEAILKEHPDTAEARYGLGRVHAAVGDLPGAVAQYASACELFPSYGSAYYAMAMADRKLGQNDKAQEQLSFYERYKNIVPPVDDPLLREMRDLDSSAISYLQRGAFLAQVGRIDDAIKATEKAAELDPKLVVAHTNLLSLYGRKGDLTKAEEQYRKVMALNPDQFPKAHYDYGVLLMTKGDYDGAKEAFARAIKINPTYAQAHNNLGYLLEREGKVQEAMAEYLKAVKDAPDYRQAHFNLGRILVNQGKYQEGIVELLQTLTPEDESTPAYLYALGAAYGRSGDRPKALTYLRQAKAEAAGKGQSKLLGDIERDLHVLEGSDNSR